MANPKALQYHIFWKQSYQLSMYLVSFCVTVLSVLHTVAFPFAPLYFTSETICATDHMLIKYVVSVGLGYVIYIKFLIQHVVYILKSMQYTIYDLPVVNAH